MNGSRWIEIVGAIAVVISLIFVGVELQQNTASNQSAAYQSWVAANLELNTSVIPEDAISSITQGMFDSRNLTEDTQLPFAMWNFSYFQQIQATNYLYRTGTIDRALWEVEINRGAIHLQLPGVREWWEAGGKNQLDPSFVELIESVEPKGSGWNWEPDKGFISG